MLSVFLMVLLGLAPASQAKVPTKRLGDDDLAAKLYRENCVGCHGARGIGDGPLSQVLGAPALAGKVENTLDAVSLVQVGSGDMPGYSTIFGERDTERLLSWLAEVDPVVGISPKKPVRSPDDDDDDDDSKAEVQEEGETEVEAPAEPPEPETVPLEPSSADSEGTQTSPALPSQTTTDGSAR